MFGSTTWVKPTNLYFGLFTAAPVAGVGGTEVSTVVTGYARQLRAADDLNWSFPASPPGEAVLIADLQFGAPTASWGDIVAGGVWDAPTGGNLIASGALANVRTINATDPAPKFPAGSIKFTARI
jgi:hypothetical protein